MLTFEKLNLVRLIAFWRCCLNRLKFSKISSLLNFLCERTIELTFQKFDLLRLAALNAAVSGASHSAASVEKSTLACVWERGRDSVCVCVREKTRVFVLLFFLCTLTFCSFGGITGSYLCVCVCVRGIVCVCV